MLELLGAHPVYEVGSVLSVWQGILQELLQSAGVGQKWRWRRAVTRRHGTVRDALQQLLSGDECGGGIGDAGGLRLLLIAPVVASKVREGGDA